MSFVDSLQSAIQYIEEHLLESITVEDIAKAANVSPFYFQRIFILLTDLSVGEYIRRRRLTLAANELIDQKNKVIDIALKYGYNTPESFSKAFRKLHGISPREAKKGKEKVRSYPRLTIQVNLKGTEPMEYRIVDKDEFQVIGIQQVFSCSTMIEGEKPEISNMWNELNQNGTTELLGNLNNGKINGLLGIIVDESKQTNEMIYWIATESNSCYIPPGLSSFYVPAAKWAVFEVLGSLPQMLVHTWKQIISEWLPSNGYCFDGKISFEVYKQSTSGCEIWIPIGK